MTFLFLGKLYPKVLPSIKVCHIVNKWSTDMGFLMPDANTEKAMWQI